MTYHMTTLLAHLCYVEILSKGISLEQRLGSGGEVAREREQLRNLGYLLGHGRSHMVT